MWPILKITCPSEIPKDWFLGNEVCNCEGFDSPISLTLKGMPKLSKGGRACDIMKRVQWSYKWYVLVLIADSEDRILIRGVECNIPYY